MCSLLFRISNFKKIIFIVFFSLASFQVCSLSRSEIKLSGDSWEIERVDEYTHELYFKELGKLVTIRFSEEDISATSLNDFMKLVLQKLTGHQDYAGARFTKISSQKLNKQHWLYFSLKRQDDIHQEIWVNQREDKSVIVFLYTASDEFYKKYRKKYLQVLKEI